jgi:3'-phosphoadenosine 5'-phosphosulfate sulfotransferase (PAPS reductase)/FAD synthetase
MFKKANKRRILLENNKTEEILIFTDMIEHNLTFVDTFAKTNSIMEEYKDKKIRIAYSGGSDSDTMMWLMKWLGYNIIGVFYDTGLEYNATWKHLDYMKSKGFNIEIIKAKRSIPTSQNKYGHAFISKQVAEMLERLQHHDFNFQKDGNLSFEELLIKYPKTKSALRWWTNNHNGRSNNISWNKGLKEFLIQEGLPFKVSGQCCNGAKKLPVKQYAKENKKIGRAHV